MYTDVMPYEQATVSAAIVAPSATALSTTLYDLIRIVQDMMTPHGDLEVTAVVAYLLHSGYLTFETDAPAHEVCLN
jgi:hypothetical protein